MAAKEASLLLKIKTAGEEALSRVADGFSNLKEYALVSFAAISAVVIKSIADYRQQEEATNSLTRAMVNQGIYSKALKDDYLEQASALQKLTLYGDEQIIGAQGVLQGYLGQTKVSKELLQATLDLAAAKKIDLASAAEMVGKSVGTSTNALARNGIEVSANATKQEKLAQVLDQVNTRYGGQAEAAAKGYGGLTQLANVASDLFETIGERLLPVVSFFTDKLKALGTDAQFTNNVIDGFLATLQALAQTGIVVYGVVETLGKVLGTGLAAAFEAVSQAASGNFKQALETAKAGVVATGQAITSSVEDTQARLRDLNNAFIADTQASQAEELALEKESLARKSEVRLQAATDDAVKMRELQIEQQGIDMELLKANEEQKAMAQIDAQIKTQQAILKNATDSKTKLAALNEVYRLNELKKEQIASEMQIKNRDETLSKIATLQNSSNKTLAMAGKAAAITQIAIETPVAISKALSAFPPPFNFAAAGLVGAAMAAQAANIAGVQLAEGGIVMPRPGGTQATIGEAGQAEAVIPLDRAGEFGLGGGNTTVVINSYGGMLGSESEARQFAVAVDRQLLKLRQNNESVAFDSGVV